LHHLVGTSKRTRWHLETKRMRRAPLDRYRGGNENFALVIVTSCGFEVEPDGLHEGIEVIDDSLVAAIEL
jgi:hypothetical protein